MLFLLQRRHLFPLLAGMVSGLFLVILLFGNKDFDRSLAPRERRVWARNELGRDDEDGVDTIYVQWFHSFPRYNWKFQSVTNTFSPTSDAVCCCVLLCISVSIWWCIWFIYR